LSIYAIDFDGTLCEKKYPNIGNKKESNVQFVKNLQDDGHQLVLWTCRKDDELQAAVDWCADEGIEFDAINENLPEIIEKYGGDSRKIHADFYVDDKNMIIDEVSISERKKLLRKKIESLKKR
jgi:hypothetical protein